MSIDTVDCSRCEGTGEDPPGTPCPRCGGDGQVPADWYNIVENRLLAIQAEQASQRTDLTAALTQIWDKVK